MGVYYGERELARSTNEIAFAKVDLIVPPGPGTNGGTPLPEDRQPAGGTAPATNELNPGTLVLLYGEDQTNRVATTLTLKADPTGGSVTLDQHGLTDLKIYSDAALQEELTLPKTWTNGDTPPSTLYMVGSSSSTNLQSAQGTLDLTYKATLADDGVEQSIKDTVGVTLLPFEVKDVKGPDASDDVIIQTQGTSQTDYTGKSIAWIEPELANGGPQMPQLEAGFTGADSMTSLNVEWKIEVKYDRGNGSRTSRNQTEDKVNIPATGFVTKPAGEAWKIYQESDWTTQINNSGFFGGEAILTMKISGQAEQSFYFRIGGKNPSNTAGRQFIDGEGNSNEWFSYAIAKHETAEYRYNGSLYNQFRSNPSSGKLGLPTWNLEDGPGGYGVFQITGSPTDPDANIPRRHIWNWQENVRAYFAIIRHSIKSGLASRFFADLQNDPEPYPSAFSECPPPEIPVGNHVLPAGEAIWITSYNGWGPPANPYPLRARFVFDPAKPCGLGANKRWFWNPPNNPDEHYIDKVERQIDQ